MKKNGTKHLGTKDMTFSNKIEMRNQNTLILLYNSIE